MINLENITKSYKNDFWAKSFNAIDNLSFNIKEDSLTGFLGANGAGKTTSVKIMLDLIRPSNGRVTYNSCLGTNKKNIFKEIGYFPERPYFYADLTAEDFIHLCGKLNDIKTYDINSRLIKWAEFLGIDFAIKRKVRSFSKGMLQKLGFIASIIHDPKLVILDEPMAGLDPKSRILFKDAFKKLRLDGKTIFFSSHIVSDIEEICDHIVILDKGKLIHNCSLEDLFRDHILSFKLNYHFKGQQIEEVVSNEEKNQKLKDLINSSHIINSVTPITPSLESLVYGSHFS